MKIRLKNGEERYYWIVEYYSKAFCNWYNSLRQSLLRGDITSLRNYIEHDKETVRAFLRGIFDADGEHRNISRKPSRIALTNTNFTLLHYVQYLLWQYFSILSCIQCRSNKAAYDLFIRRKIFINKFLDEIRFTITRKQQGVGR